MPHFLWTQQRERSCCLGYILGVLSTRRAETALVSFVIDVLGDVGLDFAHRENRKYSAVPLSNPSLKLYSLSLEFLLSLHPFVSFRRLYL